VIYDAASDHYLVVWREYYSATDYDLYAKMVSATGVPMAKFAVATANDVQRRARMAQNRSTGEVLMVWDDFRAQSYDIYGQRWRYSAPGPTSTPTATPTQTPTTLPPTATLRPTATWVWGPNLVHLPLMLRNY
jgi:hypothetical protein